MSLTYWFQFQAKTFMSKSYSDTKFFSLLSDPTKKSVKIPNSKLRYASVVHLADPFNWWKPANNQ
jgi:hypothetical protein